MSSPARFLLFVLLVVVGVKTSEQLYALVMFRDERALVRDVRDQLGAAGAELVDARARMDSLRTVMEGEDRALEAELLSLKRYYRHARGNALPADIYPAYSAELTRYNLHVTERNAMSRRLEAARGEYHAAAGRYNRLADSIHGLAVRMGERYYQVPTPLEAATEFRRTPH